jgi:Fe-S-cluster-containing hydrogenase component 2
MMNGKWFEVFRAGRQTDSAGHTQEWTEEDLDKIVAKYNAQSAHEAPLVVGHPEHNSPSFGWVEGLKREGKILYAKAKDIMPEFAELVRKGTYKKRSISLYPDMTLRHIGFLGGMPPAIKGLADIQFKSGEQATTYEFEEFKTYGRSPLQRLLGAFMDAMKAGGSGPKSRAQFCADCSAQVCTSCCPTSAISMTEDKGAVIDPAKCNMCYACCEACTMMNGPVNGMSNYNEKENEMKPEEVKTLVTEAVAAAVKPLSTQLTAFSEENKTLKEEVAGLRKQIGESDEASARRELEQFCESEEMRLRITPAQRPAIVTHMLNLRNAEPVEFDDGQGGKVKRTQLDVYKDELKSLPEVVQFGELATGGRANQTLVNGMDAQTLATKAREYQDSEASAGRTVTMTQAVAHIKKGGK